MVRTTHLDVRLSAGEILAVAAAAAAAGLPPSAWARLHLLQAAEALPAPPGESLSQVSSRPPAPLSRPAHTRLTAEQYEALEAHARACGMPVSRYIRQVLLGVKPIARRPLAHSAIVALNRVGNNFNQLVKLAHTGVILGRDLLGTAREVLGAIAALQTALLEADQPLDPEADS